MVTDISGKGHGFPFDYSYFLDFFRYNYHFLSFLNCFLIDFIFWIFIVLIILGMRKILSKMKPIYATISVLLILIIGFLFWKNIYYPYASFDEVFFMPYTQIRNQKLAEDKARQVFDQRIGRNLGYKYPIKIEKIQNLDLEYFFQHTNFYQAEGGYILPPGYTIIALSGEKSFDLPADFNKLLVNSKISINSNNAFRLAKIFILLTKPEVSNNVYKFKYPEYEYEKEEEVSEYVERYDIFYKYRILLWIREGGVREKWFFAPQNGQWKAVKQEIIDIGVGNFEPANINHYQGYKGSVKDYYPALGN